MQIIGDIPKRFSIVASCDEAYLKDHGQAFAASCGLANNNMHIHIVNPSNESFNFALDMSKKLKNITDCAFTCTYEETDLSVYTPEERRTYYACSRFLLADKLLQLGSGSLLLSDIDCVVMKHIEEPNADLGLFLREPLEGTVGWEQAGTRVAAGVVYYHYTLGWFAERVARYIDNNKKIWFLDQVALSNTYNNNKDFLSVFRLFDSRFMDWEFREGTTMWTGKGPRKYENKTYLAKKKEFEDLLK